MEVLDYVWPYFVGRFPVNEAQKPCLIYGRYLQFRIPKWQMPKAYKVVYKPHEHKNEK